MILSVSRRTDIPAFYIDWFFNRLKEGFVYVRNPMNIHRVSKIVLSPEVIDCIVFWSKDPKPMLSRLDELKEYMTAENVDELLGENGEHAVWRKVISNRFASTEFKKVHADLYKAFTRPTETKPFKFFA